MERIACGSSGPTGTVKLKKKKKKYIILITYFIQLWNTKDTDTIIMGKKIELRKYSKIILLVIICSKHE